MYATRLVFDGIQPAILPVVCEHKIRRLCINKKNSWKVKNTLI